MSDEMKSVPMSLNDLLVLENITAYNQLPWVGVHMTPGDPRWEMMDRWCKLLERAQDVLRSEV